MSWLGFFSQPAPFVAVPVGPMVTPMGTPVIRSSLTTQRAVDQQMDQTPVRSSDDFKIVIVLDESGSMECIRHDMVKAINNLITEQKQIKDRKCRFTLVKFNDVVTRVIENMDLQEVRHLTLEDYRPDKTTALFDAIGNTVDWFRYEKNVLMVIVTDGQENASRTYNRAQIKNMLGEKQNNRDWTYVYLSNDLSTARQGDSIGLQTSSGAYNCVLGQSAFGSFCSKNLNSAISNYRNNGISVQSQLSNGKSCL